MNIFTWNMQKGRTIIDADGSNHPVKMHNQVRLDALKTLWKDCEFGLVTEPGLDIRAGIKTNAKAALKRYPGNYLYCDQQKDEQSDESACRPLIISMKAARLGVETAKFSGKTKANRFPAAAVYEIKGHRILVASLHATSGDFGRKNTEIIIKELASFVEKERLGGMIVGGDFNSNIVLKAKWDRFDMPNQPTNQGNNGGDGGGIDGFFYLTNPASPKPVEFRTKALAKPIYVVDSANYALKLASESKGGGFYTRRVEMVKEGMKAGLRDHWYRLSDHAPVLQTVNLHDATGAFII